MEVVPYTSSDFYYLYRLRNMEKLYKECDERMLKLLDQFDYLVDSEKANPVLMAPILDSITTLKQLMLGIILESERIRLEVLN